MIHYHPSLSVVTSATIGFGSINFVPLFSIIFQFQPSLPIILHHCISIIIHYYPSVMIHFHPLLSVVTVAILRSESINYVPLFSIFSNLSHHYPSLSIIIHHHPSLSLIVYPSSSIGYESLSSVIISGHNRHNRYDWF